jgi:dipeptidyl aminopeptidase/acylaminoacyl peptidase
MRTPTQAKAAASSRSPSRTAATFDGSGGRERGRAVLLFHHVSRRWVGLLAAFLGGLLLLPAPARSQAPERDQKIAELEKQLAELKKKLAELKAAEKPKTPRPIAMADVAKWPGLRGTALSPNGEWFAYRQGPAEGDGEVVVRQTKGDKEYKFPAGETETFGGPLTFAHDSKWLAFSVNPPKPASEATTPPPTRGNKVALVNLATGDKTEFEGVRRFVFSGEAATHLALQKAPATSPTAGAATGPAPVPPIGPRPATPPERSGGADLVLRDLANGSELTLGNVAEFAFDKKGRWLALAIDAKDGLGNGVQLRDMTNAALNVLDSGKATYQGLHWTEKGDGLAVLKGFEDKAYEGKFYSVLGFTQFNGTAPQKVVYDPGKDATFPKGMTVSPNRAPAWTEDLGGLLFGIHEIKKKEEKSTAKEGEKKEDPVAKPNPVAAKSGSPAAKEKEKEKPDLVIWHWMDERLQSQQQVQAPMDKNFSYLALYRPAEKKFHRLADDTVRQVTPAPKERWAIGIDVKPYQRLSTLDGRRYEDVYAIDLQTGTRKLALTKNRWYFGPSPDGSHLLYYDDGHFFTYEMATGKTYNVTAATPHSFIDVEDDHNVAKPPGRPVGWSKDGAFVLLSDHWDVWKLPAHGGSGVNLTGNGKQDAIRYRSRIGLDPEEKGIDLSGPVYFSIYGEWTKKAGVARLDPGKTGTTRLLWEDAEIGGVQKAKNADVFLYTRETHKDSPDYYVTDAGMQNGKRLTNGVPNQGDFLWSSEARLLEYTSAKGDRLQAALFLPANYEKGKSYPTIVYIYERLSQGLHRYQPPMAMGFNKSVYTSNGYAVLMPDIKYQVNDPGRSAVWCVLPALEAAITTGVVDRNRVGLQGHSWGGYQTAFLITQTDAFKAAVAGAPLTNLVSMYSSIYWNTGSANQPIFESSQGRFTGGYWDNLEAYERNSPVYHAKNVKTPLLLLHNDKDGAVDWNQGIEYFNTLRRLEKPVVLLQYKGENHGLVKPANRKDYTVRMREFFDHHLMGKEAPGWLKEGVPHLKLEEHVKERIKD